MKLPDVNLQQNPSQDENLKKIVAAIKKELNPLKIYLFGSRARGNTHEYSDYDLVIITSDLTLGKNRLIQKAQLAMFDIPFPIDVVIYTPEEFEELKNDFGSIANEVILEGVELDLGR